MDNITSPEGIDVLRTRLEAALKAKSPDRRLLKGIVAECPATQMRHLMINGLGQATDTPLHMACRPEYGMSADVIVWLASSWADANLEQNAKQETPLHHCCECPIPVNVATVQFSIENDHKPV